MKNKHNVEFVSYRELYHDYKGQGVYVSEDKTYLYVTNIIGALLLSKRKDVSLKELPQYSVQKSDCEWFFSEKNPLSIEEWMLDYPTEGLDSYTIHHIGLFFEWFLYEPGPLVKKVEKAIDVSLLSFHELKPVLQFIVKHYFHDSGRFKLILSPMVQRILFGS